MAQAALATAVVSSVQPTQASQTVSTAWATHWAKAFCYTTSRSPNKHIQDIDMSVIVLPELWLEFKATLLLPVGRD